MVANIHTRDLKASRAQVGALIDGLASDDDKLWPHDRWYPMRFERPLAVGAKGGHGIIRYTVETYQPGQAISFRFLSPPGFIGSHGFDISELAPGTVRIQHRISMQLEGSARIWWPLVIRWLHDALIEDAFDRAEAHVLSRPVRLRTWSWWVRFLRQTVRRRSKRKKDR